MNANFDPNGLFAGAEGLLTFGPLGLAALLLVLVIIVVLLRRVDQSQERILRLCLYIGAFCFVAALVAQAFARPAPQPAPTPDYSKEKQVLNNIAKTVDPSVAELKEINNMALAAGCPGGGSGIAIPHGGDIASRSSNVQAHLSNAKTNIEAVIGSLPGRAPN